ncbi:MAG TPA: TRAP transporter large permease subunit, partial [Desulfosarcina sp.]|nr:TRAP transporter large permease subunit [Desulfosarcina sp.]
VEIGMIFKAALVPGLVLVAALCAYAFCCRLRSPRTLAGRTASLKQVGRTFLDAAWDWPVIGIILTGVYGGFVTIAEVSVLVLIYVVVVECLILKEISFFKALPAIIVDSAVLSGAIIVILGVALGFTGFLVDEQIPQRILGLLTQWTHSRFLFLAGLNLFLLAVGCIMDIFSAIVIVVPIIVPIALSYGVDPIHLGVIFLVNLEIGYATPPVGINLFIASMRFQKPVTMLYRASLPYLILMLGILMMITYLPWLSLFAAG